ncbi:MAG: DEAD/DEAH box helicase [Microbacteriaceae bacterium]
MSTPSGRNPRAKNFVPRDSAGKKPRWAKAGKPAGAGKPARAKSGYPKTGGVTAAGERFERPARDDRAPRSERFERSDRPARDDRAPRSDRFDRDSRPARDDRGSRSDRFDRSDRPARDDRAPRSDRFDRDSRPARVDRGPRSDRYDRPAQDDRASRYARDDRAPRGDRPYRGDRPFRPTDGSPDNNRTHRPHRNPNHHDAPRQDRFDRVERKRDSEFYPSKSEGQAWTPEEDVVLERLQAMATTAADVDGVSFTDLGLGRNIAQALAELGATAPFPIQAATIPDVLAGRHVLGRGRTGSGKTIAFGAPLVERLMENGGGKRRAQGRAPRALILAPTRELAQQINRTVMPIAKAVGLFTTTIVGGVPQGSQVMSIRRGVDILIATPGRLEDLERQGVVDLSNITLTVLDEADHMCDLGFLEPVQRILRATDPEGQRLLFSATLDKGVAAIIDEFLENPAIHEVAGEDQASATIDHRVFVVDHRDKIPLIEHMVRRDGKTLIFTRTRAYADQLSDALEDAGIRATSLHGDLNQARRNRNLEKLTKGIVNVLVATDVAARGIHVDEIDLVIQADAPDEYKTYLHRSGRTGRAGRHGTVVTLIPKQRQRRMTEMLERAEIQAMMVPTRVGDPHLDNLV